MTSKTAIKQRKRIAQDVLDQLDAKRITARSGSYIRAPDTEYWRQFRSQAVHPYVPPKSCEACAIASMFIAAVDRYNKVKLRHHPAGDDMTEALTRWWPVSETRLMEVAFERDDMPDAARYPDLYEALKTERACAVWERKAERAGEWGARYETDDERLRAICHKILRSKDGGFRV